MITCELLDKTLFAHRARKMSTLRSRIDNTLAGARQSQDTAYTLGEEELDQTLGLLISELRKAMTALTNAEAHLWKAERIAP